ncbi:gephyrin-like molybdotransferase Glp [Roseomonas sp. BN140053]|uniref:molybdopterin molybdotransferase MoeA n=1 Tax=Roseomonas sp. BN140053 TaxID=3391898 RepID=UPI0039ED5187
MFPGAPPPGAGAAAIPASGPQQPDPCAADAPLSIEAAFAAVVETAAPLAGTERLPLAQATGRVLAAELATPIPLPPFDNAAMDGFGVAEEAVGLAPPFARRLVARYPAGGEPGPPLAPGDTVRVLTGAALPPGVAAVLYGERCEVAGDAVRFTLPLRPGQNIRRAGEDAPAGAPILLAGTLLDARHIALAAAAGLAALPLRRRPRIGLLSTGNELLPPGEPLRPGTIHDSNRPMLAAVLAAPWAELHDLGILPDDRAAIAERLRAQAGLDLIVSSGAVSGSEADQLAAALRDAGGEATPLRVAQKPGKPLLHGRLGATRVLGLPGNPVAAFLGAILFARPLVRRLAGLPAARPRGIPARLRRPASRGPVRVEFAPARLLEDDAEGRPVLELLGPASSARLVPLAAADGLAELVPGEGEDRARFHAFPPLLAAHAPPAGG